MTWAYWILFGMLVVNAVLMIFNILVMIGPGGVVSEKNRARWGMAREGEIDHGDGTMKLEHTYAVFFDGDTNHPVEVIMGERNHHRALIFAEEIFRKSEAFKKDGDDHVESFRYRGTCGFYTPEQSDTMGVEK